MSDISISSNQTVVLSSDPNENDGVQWTPNDPNATIVGNDYGTFSANDVIIDNDKVTVITSKGALAFSGPELEEAKEDFSQYDYDTTTQNLSNAAPDATAMMYEMISLMLSIDLQLATSDRIARQADRADALNQAIKAGKDLMANALVNLVMGVVGGAISIAGGLVSGLMQFRGASALGEGAEELGMAKFNAKVAGNEESLAETNVEIAQTKQEIADLDEQIGDNEPTAEQVEQKTQLQERLGALEEKSANLKQERVEQLEKVNEFISKTEDKLANVKAEKATQQEKLEELEEIDNPNALQRRQINTTKARLDKADAEIDNLQARLDRLNGTKQQMESFGEPPDPENIQAGDLAELQQKQTEANAYNQNAQVEKQVAWQRFDKVLTQVQLKASRWDGVRALSQGLGQTGATVGGYYQAQGEKEKGIDEAHASEAQSYAQQHGSDYDRDISGVQQFLDLWKDVVDNQRQVNRDVWA